MVGSPYPHGVHIRFGLSEGLEPRDEEHFF